MRRSSLLVGLVALVVVLGGAGICEDHGTMDSQLHFRHR